ncbi:MAG: hypothetical protein VX599_05265 [Pseudomonadota bacterium]|nr:hypothetical protein [Pseudomonadota bacterium]
MSEAAAETLVLLMGIYAVLGLFVGLIVMFGGAGRIDPAAKGKGLPLRARILILPGIIGLWPIMLTKLFAQKEPPIS